jgi:PIN domain nuclease of toxin-antitoxin system
MNNLLLDTHVWIWLMNGDTTLSAETQQRIDEAHKQGGVFIAAISIWEVAMLEQKKRITLSKPCLEWIKTSINCGIQIVPLTPEISVDSCMLPEYLAGDPADRLIIATARVTSLDLLTRDQRILAYGQQSRVSTVAV